ncbi:MAG: methyl-accepting chemotaxis protein [Alphaproteobacteria bacterium]|nr:methyl-accepting chemotaxis protein [Alphaproteobacteria bacterium]
MSSGDVIIAEGGSPDGGAEINEAAEAAEVGKSAKPRRSKIKLNLKAIGIRAKILLGFAAVMIMLVVVAVAGNLGFLGIRSDVTELTKSVDQANLATGIENNFLKLQAQVYEFASTGNQTDAAAVQQYVGKIQENIDKAFKSITDEGHLERLQELSDTFGEYMAIFEQVSASEDKNEVSTVTEILGTQSRIILEHAGWLADIANKGEKAHLAGTENALNTTEFAIHIISAIGFVLGLITAFVMGRAISRPIIAITVSMSEIADGNVEAAIPGDKRGDEIGTMARSLKDLRDAVKKAFELGQLGQMVDDMPLNVMMCDAEDLKITYLNKAMTNTLEGLEDILPTKVDDMIGQSVDAFHENPERQRRLLADPNNLPHSANIKVGDEQISVKVNAVRDNSGNYIGPMLSWTVITDQVELSEKVMKVVKNVSSASTQMRSTAEGMSATAEETSAQSTAVAAAAEQATSNVQTVASAAEEMSASVAEINRQVAQSSEIANRANAEAGRTNETVQGLAESASKIGEVVNLISDIAEQTNLLALNATIEAARAGEAGKGFAVVASEVKNLATQTAKATEEIAAQVTDMQSVTNDAVEAIKSIGDTIAEVNAIASTISAAVAEQGGATQKIAENTQHAATGTQEVSSNITGVTQAASETGAAAQQVLGAADELSKQADALHDEVEAFLAQVKAS